MLKWVARGNTNAYENDELNAIKGFLSSLLPPAGLSAFRCPSLDRHVSGQLQKSR